jgi:hypothetical protein
MYNDNLYNDKLINYHTIPRTVVSTEAHSWRKRHQGCACDGSGRTDATPHSRPRHAIYVIYCVFPVFAIYAICVMRYPPDRRPISREDAHPMYPRVFIYIIIYCPPPTNLCEKGWGDHCRVLVRLLALCAKINWFFSKKNALMMTWMKPNR